MCGICGIVAFDAGLRVEPEILTAMTDSLRHRGPDDAGSFIAPDRRVALGHRRLSIIDLSPAGHQPMSNEDGSVWIAYNGEVYNHQALRQELEAKGHRFRSATDTEAIVHLYEEEGERCVERLEGMFALAIWDERRRSLLLARDRIGVKPLYYAQLPGGVVFGSEVKAILEHPAVARELDERAFSDYLTFSFVPAPRTLFERVFKLSPAERMTVSLDGSVRRERWWTPFSASAFAAVEAAGDDELVTELRDLLRESISQRMMSDVPFGVFLSGGLDSSTNVALMAELIDRPVRTFSVAPRGYARYDERDAARIVAGRFATEHHEVLVDDAELEEFLPLLADHQDDPAADWTAVPQHFVSRLAKDTGTIVIQCGEGADELLHGYDGYAAHRRFAAPFQRLPGAIRAPAGRLAALATRRVGHGIRHGEALSDAGSSRIPYWGGEICFRGAVKRQIAPAAAQIDPYRDIEHHWDEAAHALHGTDIFQKMTYLELQQRLPELLLTRLDKLTMANSVEGRDPFLDHRLVEFALALPPAAEVPRWGGEVGSAAGNARHPARRDHRPAQAGLRHADGGMATGFVRGPRSGNRQSLDPARAGSARVLGGRPTVRRPPRRPG